MRETGDRRREFIKGSFSDIPRPARVAETIRHRRHCIPAPFRALSVTHHTNVGRSDPEPGFGPAGRVCRGNRLVVGQSEHGSQRTATRVAYAEHTDLSPLTWSQLVLFAQRGDGDDPRAGRCKGGTGKKSPPTAPRARIG
jgi:hypothetical protein